MVTEIIVASAFRFPISLPVRFGECQGSAVIDLTTRNDDIQASRLYSYRCYYRL